MKFAKRALVAPSATMTINSLALQKKKEGKTVFNFATGDPVLKNHTSVIDAALKTVKRGMSPYPPVAGISELREAACHWMNQTYQTHYTMNQTVVTCGGKFAIYAIIQSLLDPGDQALILSPYWVSYPGIVELAEATAVVLGTEEENEWKVTASQIANKLTPKVKLLILNNGCNPTGSLYSRQELFDILSVCKENQVFVVSDEVYSELVFDGSKFISCGSFPEFRENVAVVQSCSKNFAMAGWRVGFAFAPEQLIKTVIAIQGQSTTGTSIQSQQAAFAALQNATQVTSYVREEMGNRRRLFVDTFNDAFQKEIIPRPSAVYLFLPLSNFGVSTFDSVTFCQKILEEGNVALVPGVAFGKEGYVRFAFSEAEEDIVNGLAAFSKVCRNLKNNSP